ncbi:MAG: hypothetical protein Tsb0032_16260 [Kiloniellaceae bacterium]
MIPSSQEIIYRLYGALRLARFDSGGANYFETSPEAAARSFFAALLVAPAYFFIDLLMAAETPAQDVTLFTVLVEILIYSLSWTVFPVVAHFVCLSIDRQQAYFRFLAATNWAKVLTYHLGLALFALVFAEVLPASLGALLGLGAVGYLIGYQWFIARSCLNISAAGAAGFLMLQILIDFFIVSFVAVIFT